MLTVILWHCRKLFLGLGLG